MSASRFQMLARFNRSGARLAPRIKARPAMRDLREVAELKEHWKFLGPLWRNIPFAWKRWDRFREDWTHDHCEFCFACICNHRDRFPDIDPGERGC